MNSKLEALLYFLVCNHLFPSIVTIIFMFENEEDHFYILRLLVRIMTKIMTFCSRNERILNEYCFNCVLITHIQ